MVFWASAYSINFVSKALIFFSSAVVKVHPSHPYMAVGNMHALTIFKFVCLSCPFQIFSIFLSCPAAMAVLLLISFEHFPFPSTLDPRYSKFSKHSTVSPSTVMSDVFLHLSVSTILVFFILRKRPCSHCILWLSVLVGADHLLSLIIMLCRLRNEGLWVSSLGCLVCCIDLF